MKILNVTFHTDTDSFAALNWRVFIFSVIVGFLVALMQNSGLIDKINPQRLLSPLSDTSAAIDRFAPILAKLELPVNTFTLSQKTSFIRKASAAHEFEQASGYIVVDYDSGEILASKNDDQKLAIASLTKVMTAVVALDLAASDEVFTVSKRAASQIPTKIGLVPGQKLKLDEVLHAVLLTSANDAAELVKEGVNRKYGEDIFIKAMNEKARILRLDNTHFENPQGFDGKKHYSSARDLAILAHYALENYPLIREIVAKDYQQLSKNAQHKQYDLYNWNGLIGVYPNVSGVKIGNTEQAGKTTMVISEREGKKLLVVLLGAPSVITRDYWASQLLDIGFSESAGIPMVKVSEAQLKEKYRTWKYWN